jgi:ABC-type iron transport system FetAB ATPase subunit
MSLISLIDVHSLASGLFPGSRQHLTLDLAGPGCLGLTGPSGSGKTLLLRAIADLDPSGGTVKIDGQDRTSFTGHAWRRRVGYLPAESSWWSDRVGDHFITDNVYGLGQLGFTDDVLDWSVTRLSSGERQRLALSRLLSCAPDVLLLDEPTASLDPARTANVEELIADYGQARQAPVIWVSHDAAQLKQVAQRTILLNGSGHARELS